MYRRGTKRRSRVVSDCDRMISFIYENVVRGLSMNLKSPGEKQSSARSTIGDSDATGEEKL